MWSKNNYYDAYLSKSTELKIYILCDHLDTFCHFQKKLTMSTRILLHEVWKKIKNALSYFKRSLILNLTLK